MLLHVFRDMEKSIHSFSNFSFPGSRKVFVTNAVDILFYFYSEMLTYHTKYSHGPSIALEDETRDSISDKGKHFYRLCLRLLRLPI